MRICCVIPAYDESGNLGELTKRLLAQFEQERIEFNITYVIQGGKNDLGTVERLKKKYGKIDYLYYTKPLGIGKAYKIGFRKVKAKYTHILTMDADLNHRPEEIPKFISAYNNFKADVIIGSRFIKGGETLDRRPWKILASKSVNRLISFITKNDINDKTSGFRLIRNKCLMKIRNKLKEKGYPSYLELILLAKKQNSKIIEIPITYLPRRWGKSKMSFIRTSWDYLRFLYTQTRGTFSIDFV